MPAGTDPGAGVKPAKHKAEELSDALRSLRGPKEDFPSPVLSFTRLRFEAALAEQVVERYGLDGSDQKQRLARLQPVHRVEDRNQRRPARRKKRAHVQLERRQGSHRGQYAIVARQLP